MIYTKNLYQQVLKKNMKNSRHLDIISGYVSSFFLEYILEEFPEVSLTIYIGMALDGISLKEHQNYIHLSNEYADYLKIYYQVEQPRTHAKIYSFDKTDGSNTTYVGSANFSKNGFMEYQEVLVKTLLSIDHLFSEVEEKSLECWHPNVQKYISFFTEEPEVNPVESVFVEELPYVTNNGSKDTPIPTNSRKIYRKETTEPYMVIPILPLNAFHINNRGINAWHRKQTPYLIESNNYPFTNYFPTETTFDVVTDSGKKFKCQLNKQDYSRLIFEPSLYDYLRLRLGVEEKRPITHVDIEKKGENEIYVFKEDEDTYYFDFCLRNN